MISKYLYITYIVLLFGVLQYVIIFIKGDWNDIESKNEVFKLSNLKNMQPAFQLENCTIYGVVTTIFGPTSSLTRFLELPNTCAVVIGDKRTNDKYWDNFMKDKVFYASAANQGKMNFNVYNNIPWNHFGRKNIGYLIAIAFGAQCIFDFDDDNKVKKDVVFQCPSNVSSSLLEVTVDSLFFNPYLSFQPVEHNHNKEVFMWPRGFPLQFINNNTSFETNSLLNTDNSEKQIGIIQYLADHDPDVDAIFRLTRKLPIYFTKYDSIIISQHGKYSPWNAQATLMDRKAFFGLCLPITVTGRVSDIWRSYITTRLLWEANLSMAFASSAVIQFRNPHNYMTDFNDELDLYMKSTQLIEQIHVPIDKSLSLADVYLELIHRLVNGNILQNEDLLLARSWVSDLKWITYKWPLRVGTDLQFDLDRTMLLPKIIDGRNHEQLYLPIPKRKVFWTSDLHDGTRIDVPSALIEMGHEVINGGHKRLQGPYPDILAKMRQPSRELSPIIDKLNSHNSMITQEDADMFYEYYQNDPDMKEINAFLCQFPASFCEIYMKLNRSIIIIASHRIFLGRCKTTEIDNFIKNLKTLHSNHNPKSFILASNKYDAEYIKHFTGIDAHVLPALGTSYIKLQNLEYRGNRDEILVGPLQISNSKYLEEMNKYGNQKWKFVAIKALYPHFSMQDICNHRAVVLLPYAVHSFGITEIYGMGVPLFVPSVDFLIELDIMIDKNVNDPMYCGESFEEPVANEHSLHPYSPENRSVIAMRYWLKFCEFYQFNHIVVFENWGDLINKLDSSEFIKMHQLIESDNHHRTERRMEQLSNIISFIT